MRLYTRQQVLETDELLEQLLQVLLRIMKENTQTIMPGFTHLQKAQPITLAHHMGAYFEMFKRDRSRMHDIYERMNYCPLGSVALAGTTYPLDREYTAELLGFYGCIQYRKQYHATEEKSGYCRTCPRQDRACVWRAHVASDHDEGDSACLQ